jgi:hypothetical protein
MRLIYSGSPSKTGIAEYAQTTDRVYKIIISKLEKKCVK